MQAVSRWAEGATSWNGWPSCALQSTPMASMSRSFERVITAAVDGSLSPAVLVAITVIWYCWPRRSPSSTHAVSSVVQEEWAGSVRTVKELTAAPPS